MSQPEERISPPGGGRRRGDGGDDIRVLVVDDDEGMVATLHDILGAAGYDVDVALSGHVVLISLQVRSAG